MISATDIAFVLSGGATNRNIDRSIGGPPASQPVLGVLNNLFKDLTNAQSLAGRVDHRCIYVFNDHPDLAWDDLSLSLSATPDCCDMAIGIKKANEVQQLRFADATSGGGVVFGFGAVSFAIAWVPDLDALAASVQAALRQYEGFEEVVCAGDDTGEVVVNFVGGAGNRALPLLAVATNSLTPSGVACVVTRTTEGSPLNAEAFKLTSDLQTPAGVDFAAPTGDNPTVVGRIRPGAGVAVWVRRSVAANTPGDQSGVGFSLRFDGKAIIV